MYYRMGKPKSAIEVMQAALKRARQDKRGATDSKNFAIAQINAAVAALRIEPVFTGDGAEVRHSGVPRFNETTQYLHEVRAHSANTGESLLNAISAIRILVQAKYFAAIQPADGDDPSNAEVQQELRKAKLAGRRGLSAPLALRRRFGAMMTRNGDMRKFIGQVRQAFHLSNQQFSDGVRARAIRDILTEGSAVSQGTVAAIEQADRTNVLDRHKETQVPTNSAKLDDRVASETKATVRRLLDPQQPVLVAAVLGEATALYLMGAYPQARAIFAAAIRREPSLPASVRVGLGMTLLGMGHRQAALQAFSRALQLDNNNTAALTGHAVLSELSADSASGEQQARSKTMALALLHRAHDIDSTCPAALLHLARTSFFDWHRGHAASSTASSSSSAAASTFGSHGKQPLSAQLRKSAPYLYLSGQPDPPLRKGELLRLVRGGTSRAGESASAASGGQEEEEAILVRVNTRNPEQGPPAVHPSLRSDEFEGTAELEGHVRVRLQQPVGASGGGWRLYRRDYTNSGNLAKHAASATTNPRTRAEALYLCARAKHAKGQYAEAARDYDAATKQRPAMAVAHMGQGQCLIATGSNTAGRKCI